MISFFTLISLIIIVSLFEALVGSLKGKLIRKFGGFENRVIIKECLHRIAFSGFKGIYSAIGSLR